MIHARDDYNRFQDPAAEPEIYRWVGKVAALLEEDGIGHALIDAIGDANVSTAALRAFAARAELPPGSSPIGVDEPVFLLRAKDIVSPNVVEHWAYRAQRQVASEAIVDLARKHAMAMRAWQNANGCKVPELPEEAETL